MSRTYVALHKRAVFLLALVCLLAGCSTGKGMMTRSHPKTETIPAMVGEEARQLETSQQALRRELDVGSRGEQPSLEPVMPVYNPLDDHIVSFSIVNEDLQMVLVSLARSVGMNITIDQNLVAEKKQVTINFTDVPASLVLEEILRTYDVFYEVKQNVIHVKSLEERIFPLNFLDTNVKTTFNVGGDVLGSSNVEKASLTGSFSLAGEGGKTTNSYDIVDEIVKGVVSEKGKYTINRMAGTLWVKDTPATVRAVARIIGHFKEMLNRQILIEARIIEIGLSDEYSYGVDWTHLRKSLASSRVLNEDVAWNASSGLVLNGGPVAGSNAINAAINALQQYGHTKIVSNPSVRTKHGQPAVISVGTSYTFLKKSETTITRTEFGTDTLVTGESSSIFDGLILGVVPFVESDQRVSLVINPIKSEVDKDSIKTEEVASSLLMVAFPQVNIKELSTSIAVDNNDVILLGGLIDRRKKSEKKGVPIVGEIPLLSLFARKDAAFEEARELVIVLKVSIL